MSNYFELLQDIIMTENSIVVNSWSDIVPEIYGNEAQELNNCLQDTWLNFNYAYRQREINMSTVAGQYNYDLPAAGFTGKIKQDGLLIQPVTINMLGQPARYQRLIFSENTEQFWQYGTPQQVANNSPNVTTTYGLPRYYCVYNNQVLLKPIPDKVYNMICLYYCRNWALSNGTVTVSPFPPFIFPNQAGQNILAVDRTQDTDIYGNTQPLYNVGDVVYIDNNTALVETGVIQVIDTVNNALIFVGNLTFSHAVGAAVSVERQALTFQTDTPNCDAAFHNTFKYGALSSLLYGASNQKNYIDYYNRAVGNMVNESRSTQEGTQSCRITRHTW